MCFTRIMGPDQDEWVFFDSMAERPGNKCNSLYLLCGLFFKEIVASYVSHIVCMKV